MKKMFLSVVILMTAMLLNAQTGMEKLPMDPEVRHGVLENGLSYYIRHNNLPEKSAEFYIIQKVGSMQEEDHQSGLAHFLEHMAFNGTTNFPDKALLNYLENNGIKFGVDINAYTSFDETVYNLSRVPVMREGLVDSCLLVLHDWACGITNSGKEIDNERGVINEEWRTRSSADLRIWEKTLPIIFPNSKYANRLPIGSMDVVNNCSYEDLRSFYRKWYRPDLQSVIIVGDFDVEVMEKKVKELFSKIPARTEPADTREHLVDDNEETIVAIETDPEKTSVSISLYYKRDPMPKELKGTQADLITSYVQNCVAGMLNSRFNEITQKPNSPFINAGSYVGEFFVAKTKDAFTISITAADDKIDVALAGVVAELEKMRRFGFLDSEYERMKSNMLSSYESAYTNRSKRYHSSFVREYQRNVLNGDACPGIEFEYNFMNMLIPNIPLANLNQFAQTLITDNNIVLSVSGPEKEGLKYPTKEELVSIIKGSKDLKLEAYHEDVITEPLVSGLPEPGKIVKTEKDNKFDAEVLTLSNGMKVVLKKTDFSDNQISMNAISSGGTSLFPIEDVVTTSMLGQICTLGGVGNFDVTTLKKVLAGKKAYVSPSITLLSQGIAGSSTIKDTETMLQLAYLYLTSPRTDKEAFNSTIERFRPIFKNMESNPSTAFSDAITKSMYGDNPYMKRMKEENLDKVDYELAMKMYKECFNNPGDLLFVFVGNIDAETLKPMIEKYLGSIKGSKDKKNFKNIDLSISKGESSNIFDQTMQTPQTSVFNILSGEVKRTQKNQLTMRMLQEVLNIVYTEKVREDEGGTYGVSVSGDIARYPENQTTLNISFNTDPLKAEHLNSIIFKELRELAEKGPRTADFVKVKEHILKSHTQRVKENGYWMSVLQTAYFYGNDVYTDYITNVNSVTENDVKELANTLLSQGNIGVVMMNPAK